MVEGWTGAKRIIENVRQNTNRNRGTNSRWFQYYKFYQSWLNGKCGCKGIWRGVEAV
jgi:hypothetical protein